MEGFLQQNENVIYKISAILLRPHFVNIMLGVKHKLDDFSHGRIYLMSQSRKTPQRILHKYLWSVNIQWSAVITQYNIRKYCIHHCRNWGRISIRSWIHRRHPIPRPNGWERGIKFSGLFGDRGHRGPYSPYKLCNHNLYIGIIIFPHLDNPQSTGYN